MIPYKKLQKTVFINKMKRFQATKWHIKEQLNVENEMENVTTIKHCKTMKNEMENLNN